MDHLSLALLALALTTVGAVAQPTLVELTPSPRSPNVEFGGAIAAVGDVTGDGQADFLFGAPASAHSPEASPGRAYVFDGATGDPVRTLTAPTGTEGAVDRRFGRAVAPLGDIDGDGSPEFAVGGSAATLVFSGADGAVLHTLTPPSGAPSDLHAIAPAGDLDGDDVPDLLASAPGAGADGNGEVYLFSGATDEVSRTFTPPSTPSPLYFGSGVAVVGDTDGDGVPDVAVGDSGARPGPALFGAVSVFSGATGAFRYTVTPEVALFGGQFGNSSGVPLAGMGDVDGDGAADFAVGAPEETVELTTEGRVYVFNGATGALLYLIEGTGYVGELGASLAAIPDLDGDGVRELAAGAPGEGGAGPFDDGRGRVHVRSGATGDSLLAFDPPGGVEGTVHFGASVAATVSGDGRLTVVAGAPFADVGEQSEVGRGRAYLYSGLASVDAAGGPAPPAGLALRAVYPNPARGVATVALDVAEAPALRGSVRVGVYDVLGRRVAVLHDGPLAAGEYALAFDGAGLPAGLYLVRVEGGGVSAARRVTVLR